MSAESLLLSLQDIGPPPEPAWWMLPPLAWWTICLLLLSISLWRWQRRRRERNRLGEGLRAELERIAQRHEPGAGDALARELSVWLKQAALLAFPGTGLEKMHGAEWLEFLDRSSGLNAFRHGAGKVFADAVYRREFHADGAVLLSLCRDWLNRVAPQLRRQMPQC